MNLPIKLGQLKICVNCRKEYRTGRKHGGKKYCSRGCWKVHWKGKNTHMWGKNLPVSALKKLKGRWIGEKNPNYGKNMSGTNNARWIMDRTLLTKRQERNDYAYCEWRKLVWIRDNFKCQMKNSDCMGKIEAHHILSWTKFPELRYEINNGITLCHFHHPFKRYDEIKLSPFFQKMLGVKLQVEQTANLVVANA